MLQIFFSHVAKDHLNFSFLYELNETTPLLVFGSMDGSSPAHLFRAVFLPLPFSRASEL